MHAERRSVIAFWLRVVLLLGPLTAGFGLLLATAAQPHGQARGGACAMLAGAVQPGLGAGRRGC